MSDPEQRSPFESERSLLASIGARRRWFARALPDSPKVSDNGEGPFVAHSMLGALASRSGGAPADLPERPSLLALSGATLAAGEPEPDPVVAPLTAHSTLGQLAGLEERSPFAFPIERAILISLFVHLLFVVLLSVVPAKVPESEEGLLAALARTEPKDDTPIPVTFMEAPGAPRPNPNRSPLSDADRRAGGGDPARPKSESPFVAPAPGIAGLAPGPRGPRIPESPGGARGSAAAEAERRAALERKDEAGESKPSEFPADMRPQLGTGREVDKLAGLDAAIREAARGAVGGEGGAPISNEDGGFVDVGGVSFETSWYDWGPYAAEMLRRIKLHWSISRDLLILQQRGSVQIGFSIMADGSVADVRVMRPSTIPPYTHGAMKAILESDPFRPLPKDLLRLVPGKDRERIVIHFIYFPTPEELDGSRDRP